MRLLLDTNIFLEVILAQANSAEVRVLLLQAREHEFFVSDYSVHSIGTLLFHRKKSPVFRQFLKDVIFNSTVRVASLNSTDLESVIKASQKSNLDFDDAYQCALADKLGLSIVSFDSDFDRTERGRKTPSDVLA